MSICLMLCSGKEIELKIKKIPIMNFDNYTIKSQQALQQAQQIAQQFEHQQIENEHLFLGIQKVDQNALPFLLKKLDLNTNLLEQIIDQEMKRLPKVSGANQMLSKATLKTSLGLS